MIGNFNEEAQSVLFNAKLEMSELGHPYIGTEHLLLAILKSNSSICERLNSYGLSYDSFRNELCKIVGTTSRKNEVFLYTPLLRKVIQNAIIDSKENNDGEVSSEHLFFSMLEEGEGIAIRIIIGMGIDIEEIYDDFSSSLIKKSKKNKKKKLLIYDLGTDLVVEAKNEKLDPVIGRDKEVKRVMEILCRRTKNNPILVGDAGVGKTAIVEELSRLIANDEVPSVLANKKIISLDMATMVAGTKYRGEFEERMKKVIGEIEANDDIILFIDEIHTLVGAGGAEGAIDASNILKPALARGKIRCIGATTTDEYKKFIEKDSALERRFQKVFVSEPSIEEVTDILMNIRGIYENYHNVVIDDDIINSIVDLSEKYIFDRNRPDKEIDILDEVASKTLLRGGIYDDSIRDIKRELSKLNVTKNSFIIDNNVDEAYKLRKRETELMMKLNEYEVSFRSNKNKVTTNDVASVISNRTGVPVYEIISGICDVSKIGDGLKNIIVGQDRIIDNLVDITKRIKCGFNNKCYSLLFVGSSGVGKSMLAKEYAKFLVGEDNFIRMDMSEYCDSTSVSKILGSSPGYVGYDDNKNVLEEIRNKPNSVLLLDEIDKAHPSVINLFYQILEEGEIRNSKGKVIKFNNVVIIMTSNAGFEKGSIGFNKGNDSSINSSLKDYFSSAFINRIDNIFIFDRLDEFSVKKIINNKIDDVKKKYANIVIDVNLSVIDEVIDDCNYYEFGARRIDKIISKNIENSIIDGVINGSDEVHINSIHNKKNITI